MDHPCLFCIFSYHQGVKVIVHCLGPGLEGHDVLGPQKIKDLELYRSRPSSVQTLFLPGFYDADKELPISILWYFSGVYQAARPNPCELLGNSRKKVGQRHARSPSFTRISWCVAYTAGRPTTAKCRICWLLGLSRPNRRRDTLSPGSTCSSGAAKIAAS